MNETPFDSIESAQEYVRLLAEQVEDVRGTVAGDTALAHRQRAARRVQALQLADYKLQQLAQHLAGCTRMLNDLRLLRRVLCNDAEPAAAPSRDEAPVRVLPAKDDLRLA